MIAGLLETAIAKRKRSCSVARDHDTARRLEPVRRTVCVARPARRSQLLASSPIGIPDP